MAVDLHAHSTASDGTLSPSELVHRAAQAGLTAVALSDHDSVDGIAEALRAGEREGIRVVPAVELSAAEDDLDVHLLGYFVDHEDPAFRARLAQLRAARQERAERIVEALRTDGYDMHIAEVLDLADGGAVGRAHVARALISRGYAGDMGEAFERYVGRGRPYYIPKPVAGAAAVVELIRSAGGLPVLAHPAVSGVEGLAEGLVPFGLAGLEAFHSEQSAEDSTRVTELAERLGLVVTGGSDYHGPQAHAKLGRPHVPDEVLADLESRRAR